MASDGRERDHEYNGKINARESEYRKKGQRVLLLTSLSLCLQFGYTDIENIAERCATETARPEMSLMDVRVATDSATRLFVMQTGSR